MRFDIIINGIHFAEIDKKDKEVIIEKGVNNAAKECKISVSGSRNLEISY